jgi:hypothetical protein
MGYSGAGATVVGMGAGVWAGPASAGSLAPGSAGALAPPFVLPGAHFVAGMAFLVVGVSGLAWVAPELAGGSYLAPRVVAVAHLFTMGWITISIFGALYQFLPVALGVGIRWAALAYLTLALVVVGLAGFATGLLAGPWWVLASGAASLALGVLVFCGNLVATLARAARRDLTWWSLAGAVFYLMLTALLGLLLAGNLGGGYGGVARWTALGVHFHVALAGWVLLVVIGVGHRLLPMFLLSHGAGEVWGRVAAVLVAVGVGWLVVAHHAPVWAGSWLPAAVLAAGLMAFLAQAASYFRRSVKPRLDPGLRLAGVALGLLGGAVVLGGWAVVGGWPSGPTTGYGLAVVLGFSLFVAAHYYKIVPFLVWYHRYGPLLGQRPVPQVADLISARWAAVAVALMAAGFVGLVAAVVVGLGAGARAAAVVGLAGVCIEAVQLGHLARRRV